MSKRQGSVRMGPASLLTLVVVLCLAVMGVLAVATAQATYAAAQKQADFTSDTYQNEQAAQNLVSVVDGALSQVRDGLSAQDSDGDSPEEGAQAAGNVSATAAAKAAISSLPASQRGGASLDGNVLSADFTAESGRTLHVELAINDNATYHVTQWRASTQWNQTGTGETLWSGSK